MSTPSSFPVFPSGMPLYRVTGGFAESGLPRSGAEIQANYFSGADVTSTGSLDIVSESDVTPTLVSEITVFADQNQGGFIDAGDQAIYAFVVKVFVSREDSYLRRAFAECEPAGNEVCFFLEDNSTDVLSDRAAYIKIGSDFAESIEKLRLLTGALHDQGEWFGVRSGESPFAGLNFTTPEIDELIRMGRIENAARDTWVSLIQLANWQTLLLGPVYSVLGNGVLALTKEVREHLKFEDHHWDPEDPAYSPILGSIPGAAIEVFEDLTDETIQAMGDSVRQALRDRVSKLSREWKQLLRGGLSAAVPSALADSLDQVPESAEACVDSMLTQLDRTMVALSALGSRALGAANAFFCGLWNGLVEEVLGLLDLVGYLLVALGAAGGAVSDPERLIPMALEILDEAFQTILTTDWPGLFDAAFSALVEGISHFNLFALTSEITIERVAYFVGGVVGLLAEIIVGLFWSGGLDSVRAVVTKFGRVGSEMFEAIRSGVTQLVGSTTTFSVDALAGLLRSVLAVIRQGKAAVTAAVKHLFTLLDDLTRLDDNVLDRIQQMLKLTTEEMNLLEAVQLRFVNLADDVAEACTVTY